MGLGSEKEVQRVLVEVLAEQAARHAGKHVAETCGELLTRLGREGEVLDEHGTGKTVLARARCILSGLGRQADVGIVVKPQDVEDAAAVSELGEERLDGVDGMQELEAI